MQPHWHTSANRLYSLPSKFHINQSLREKEYTNLNFKPGHMISLSHIINIINENREQLRAEFGVVEIGIFGSVVKGEQDIDSDIDILVEFERPVGFVRFMRLEKRLSELLGMPVDLVTKKALKPHIGKRILQDVRYV